MPDYIRRDFPNEMIEEEGWFCELFVVGIHPVEDETSCDQTDMNQWRFMVVPANELKRGQSSMLLSRAMKRWGTVTCPELRTEVAQKLDALRQSAKVSDNLRRCAKVAKVSGIDSLLMNVVR